MKNQPLLAAALVAVLTGAAPGSAQTVEEENVATFRAVAEVINARELDRLDDLVAADVVRRSQSTPGVVVTDLDGFKAFLRSDFAAVPDSRQECPIVVPEGDRLLAWCTYEGHQEGPMGPFPPTGEPVALDFAGLIRFEDGKVAEIRAVWDNLAALAQLGHLPPAAGEPAGLSPIGELGAPVPDPEKERRNREAFEVFVEAQNERDWDRLDGVVAPDMVRHSQATPGREEMRGLDAFKTFLDQSTGETPDWRIDCPTVLAEGDLIGFWCAFAGTQEGPMGPFPPSGKRMELDFAGILRFEDGKVAEWWVTWDNVAGLTQLGHFPPPESEPDDPNGEDQP